jgi:hypothetical protein
MPNENQNQMNSNFRKMMLMALIERMERLQKMEEEKQLRESGAFMTLENDNARIVVCLN